MPQNVNASIDGYRFRRVSGEERIAR
ncbi:MAG: hypothetical protein QOC81_4920, partial [Thermoanaerobaculia bacterium]|nr:hypothetical protein [Thermoanaerobaculia bacterium]